MRKNPIARNTLIELLADGCNRKDIARELSVSIAHVQKYATRYGLRFSKKKSVDLRAQFMAAVEAGRGTSSSIGRYMGISGNWARRLGRELIAQDLVERVGGPNGPLRTTARWGIPHEDSLD